MKLLIFDGNSIINRAYYAIRGLTTKAGFATNGIFGFLKLYKKYFDMVRPDMVTVTFDLREKTFRHKMYDGYKAQRKGMPDDLAAQMEPLKDILRAMNVCILQMEGYEADDIIGTVSRYCEENGHECVIVSGDRDDYQLVSDQTTLLLPVTQKGDSEVVRVDPAYLLEKYGLTPHQMIDLKSIMGDSSDNIKGVPGIGEKGALELIRTFGTLDGVYENIESDQIKKGIRQKLLDGQQDARLSYQLAEICRTVPVDLNEDMLRIKDFDHPKLKDLLLQYELASVLKLLDVSMTKKEEVRIYDPVPADEIRSYCRENKMFFTYEIKEKGISGWVKYKDGVVFAEDLEDLLWDDTVEKVTFDAKPLYVYRLKSGAWIDRPFYDVMVAQYVLDSLMTHYTPESVLLRQLQVEYESREQFTGLMEKIFASQQQELHERKQQKLLFDIELPLTVVLADMERIGFKVDKEKLIAYSEMISEKIRSLEQEIYEQAGETFNILSPKQLGVILFEKLGLRPCKKTKSGYSTNVDALEKVKHLHPVVPLVLEYRKHTKLKSTYCDGLLALMDEECRVHTSFQQTVTHTGRISSTEPNLQNIPVRTELGRQLRAMFIASDGDHILADADYSQIELRVLAHIADDKNMQNAFAAGEDIHTATAAHVFGVPQLMVTPEMRRAAKAVNFGLVYGISDFSLAQDIHVTRKEAAAYIQSYFNEYSGIKAYMEGSVAFGKEHGYVETLFGRRRELPELSSSNYVTRSFGERVAMNTPIQGTAADIIKIAMVGLHRRLHAEGLRSRIILQVHDELILDVPAEEEIPVRRILEEEMVGAAKLKVRLVADVHCGASWYDCK